MFLYRHVSNSEKTLTRLLGGLISIKQRRSKESIRETDRQTNRQRQKGRERERVSERVRE